MKKPESLNQERNRHRIADYYRRKGHYIKHGTAPHITICKLRDLRR